MRYIGVDIHLDNFVASFLNARTNENAIITFPYDDEGLLRFINKIDCTDRIAIEACGYSRHFIRMVRPLVADLCMVAPTKFSLIAKSMKKTDKNDAIALAQGMKDGILPRARIRSEVSQQIKNLLNIRGAIVKQRVNIGRQLHSVLSQAGIAHNSTKFQTQSFRDNFNKQRLQIGDQVVCRAIFDGYDTAHQQIKYIDQKIDELLNALDGKESLLSVPSLGLISCAHLLSHIDGIDDFDSPKKLAAYIGIVPRVRSSNKKKGLGPITRSGNKRVRSALVLVAFRITKYNESLQRFYKALAHRSSPKGARVAVARKLIVLIYFLLKSGHVLEDGEFEELDFTKPNLFNFL